MQAGDHAPRTAREAHKQEPERSRAHNERDAPLSVWANSSTGDGRRAASL